MHHSIESLEGRRLFTGGALDTTFATGGTVSVGFRVSSATDVVTPRQVLTDAAGHVYVAASAQGTFQVRRLNADGSADLDWGRHGILVFDDVGTIDTVACLDPAGRLDVLIGKKITRYTTAGALDTTFGASGTADLSGTFDAVHDFALDSHDRIYAVGDVPSPTKHLDQAAVVRLISRGKSDRTFQNKGVYVVPQIRSETRNESQATAEFVRVLGDDSVVVAGTVGFGTQNDSLLPLTTAIRSLKFTSGGVLDTSYGNDTPGVSLASAPASDTTTYFVDPIGIRADGTVALSVLSEDGNGNTSADDEEINAAGTYFGFRREFVQYADLSDSTDDAVTDTQFTTLADGRELATVNGAGVSVLKVGHGYDQGFNGGKEIQAGSARYGTTGVAAAGTVDDKVVVAQVGKGRTEVVLRRFLTTGTGTSPADPAAVAPPTAGGRHLTAPATSLRFNVSYLAPQGKTIDVSTIGPAALRVFGPNGGHRAPRLIDVLTNNGTYVNASYRVTDVDGSDFTAADNGIYTVRLMPNTVKYTDGTFVDGQVIGTLTVRIK